MRTSHVYDPQSLLLLLLPFRYQTSPLTSQQRRLHHRRRLRLFLFTKPHSLLPPWGSVDRHCKFHLVCSRVKFEIVFFYSILPNLPSEEFDFEFMPTEVQDFLSRRLRKSPSFKCGQPSPLLQSGPTFEQVVPPPFPRKKRTRIVSRHHSKLPPFALAAFFFSESPADLDGLTGYSLDTLSAEWIGS